MCFTEVSFASSEGNHLSYLQNGYFFKILWWSHEPHNKGICKWKNEIISECFTINNHGFSFVSFSTDQPLWPMSFKWQCRLIFESEFWKKFKVTNHRSGVTYGCTDQHLTVEKFFFQSLPRHLADTAENIKNQPYRGWKIVFLIIQRKWPKFKKWVWPVKIP